MCLGVGYFILLVLSLNQLSSEMELRIAVNIALGIVGFMFYAIIPGDAECSLKKDIVCKNPPQGCYTPFYCSSNNWKYRRIYKSQP